MTNAPNGLPAALINAAYQARMDAKPLTTRCALCQWTFSGTAGQGREQAAKHRAEHHPKLRPRRIRRSIVSRFHNPDDEWKRDGITRGAEVSAMLKARAKEEAA